MPPFSVGRLKRALLIPEGCGLSLRGFWAPFGRFLAVALDSRPCLVTTTCRRRDTMTRATADSSGLDIARGRTPRLPR